MALFSMLVELRTWDPENENDNVPWLHCNKQKLWNKKCYMIEWWWKLLLSSKVKGLSWSYPARVKKPESFSIQDHQWVKLKLT